VNVASVRIIVSDVPRLVAFYEQVTAQSARWATDQFAEIVMPGCTLAIAVVGGAVDDVVQAPTTMPWDNRSMLLRDPTPTATSSTSSPRSARTPSSGSDRSPTDVGATTAAPAPDRSGGPGPRYAMIAVRRAMISSSS